MHDRSEVFNIVAGNGYFFFRIMVHCKKERPVILGFYFINHGKINNISFMGPEKSLLGKKCFRITESHFRAYDAFGGIEKGIIRFFGRNQDDFFCGRKNECLVFRLQRNPGSGIYDFPGGGTVFPLYNTVEKALDGFRDTLFIIRFQNIVESFQLEACSANWL